MTKRWLRATAFAICGGMGFALPLSADEDNEMLEQVAAFTAAGPQGQRLPLTAVTDFEWDTVRGFSGTTPIALYRKALGEDFELDDAIIRELTNDSAVLVFFERRAGRPAGSVWAARFSVGSEWRSMGSAARHPSRSQQGSGAVFGHQICAMIANGTRRSRTS